MKHADLIARLEKLTGPDREVDGLIHVTVFGWKLARVSADYDGENASDVYTETGKLIEGFAYPPRGKIGRFYHVPNWPGKNNYTGSIDAAVALVERMLPGWKWRVSSGYGEVFQRDPDCGRDGFAPATAIALLIALLRALQESDPAAKT